MAGLVPAIHEHRFHHGFLGEFALIYMMTNKNLGIEWARTGINLPRRCLWMAGTSPAMTGAWRTHGKISWTALHSRANDISIVNRVPQ
jgi:hypothetical protein